MTITTMAIGIIIGMNSSKFEWFDISYTTMFKSCKI